MNPGHVFTAEEFSITQTNRGFAEDSEIDTNGLHIGLPTQPFSFCTFCCTPDASQPAYAQYPVCDYCGSLAGLANTFSVETSSQCFNLRSSQNNSNQSLFPCSRTTSVPTPGTASSGATYSALLDENLHTSLQEPSSKCGDLVEAPRNINGRPSDGTRPTTQAWQDIRPHFLKLYITDDLPLHVVVECLKRDHDFHATENMYKKRIKDWGISKSMSKYDKVALLKDPTKFEKQSISSRRRTLRYAKDSARTGRIGPKEVQVLVQEERFI